MKSSTKYALWLLLVMVFIIVAACANDSAKAEPSTVFEIWKEDDLGARSGAGKNGELWRDTNGCYWIYDSGGYKQIFKESSYNGIARPYCK